MRIEKVLPIRILKINVEKFTINKNDARVLLIEIIVYNFSLQCQFYLIVISTLLNKN